MGIAETTTTIRQNEDGTITVTTTTVLAEGSIFKPKLFSLDQISGWPSGKLNASPNPQVDEGTLTLRSGPNDVGTLGAARLEPKDGSRMREFLVDYEGNARNADNFTIVLVSPGPFDIAGIRKQATNFPAAKEADTVVEYKVPQPLVGIDTGPTGRVFEVNLEPAPEITAHLWRRAIPGDLFEDIWFFGPNYFRPSTARPNLQIRLKLVGGNAVNVTAFAFLSARFAENAQSLPNCRVAHVEYAYVPLQVPPP